ncbi:Glyoxalase/Bleomycin resistance protein/Dihydroxybiphenyl dioxygenase [Xylogone sp. PMI_703]|nr:Glyoxalase/Bleomycin resistance protein/Dihydroxybiphenyl dioxygenase [Xylogone sp. PMI_703]
MSAKENTTSNSEKVLSPAKLAHIVLYTNKYAQMVDFWTTFLGGRVVQRGKNLTFLAYDDEHHRVAIAEIPGTKERDGLTCGLAHVAFTYNNLDDLALSYEQRKAHGMTPFWCINHGPTISMYYHDPDGNEIETQVDCFDDPNEATRFMEETFVENPIGVDYNPEDLVKRLQLGESHASIKKRLDIGPRQWITERTIPPPSL